jgi:uncharacterized membrane protein (UPF0127 family)
MQSGWCLINTRTGGTVAADLEVADGLVSRLVGLQLRRELPRGSGLLLVPCAAVHTFFMRFPIDVIQLDGRGRVVVVRREVPPWSTVEASPWTRAVLELPVGTADVAMGDVLRLHGLGVDARSRRTGGLPDRGGAGGPATSGGALVLLVMVGLMAYVNNLPAPFPPGGLALWQITRPLPRRDRRGAGGPRPRPRRPVADAQPRHRPNAPPAVTAVPSPHVLSALVLFGIVRRTLASPRSHPLPPHGPWLRSRGGCWLIHRSDAERDTRPASRRAAGRTVYPAHALLRSAEPE